MLFPDWNRLVRLYEAEILSLMGPVSTPEKLMLVASSPKFQEAAWRVAQHMATGVVKANARSWRTAAMKSTRAREIYKALRSEIEHGPVGQTVQAVVARNAELIRSLPIDVAQRVTQYIATEQQKGQRAEVIENELRRRLPELTKSRIRLIARTEVGKSETALTRARAERIGAHWFQWATSHDQRVRPSHRNLDGVLVKWEDPPSPEELIGEKSYGHYAPGEIFNCRCVSLPLISLDEIAWPARCYLNGRISRFTRAEFTRAVGIPLAA